MPRRCSAPILLWLPAIIVASYDHCSVHFEVIPFCSLVLDHPEVRRTIKIPPLPFTLSYPAGISARGTPLTRSPSPNQINHRAPRSFSRPGYIAPLSLPPFGLGWFYNLGKSVAASFRDDDNVFNAVIVAHLAAAAAVVAREWRRKRERCKRMGGRMDSSGLNQI